MIPRPTRVAAFPNGELGIVWDDGLETYYRGHSLRCACTCAKCVDEVSGQKVLDDSRVPQDVRVVEWHPVGNYGISIRWSDGHDTGIYSYERLRQLA